MVKKKLASLATAATTLGLAVSMVVLPAALAATNPTSTNSGQALEIAPPIITLTVNPGQTVKTQIKLLDISKTDLIVTNDINDFVANGEDGTPKILLNGSGNDPFSMKNWVVPVPSTTLSPQQIKSLDVTINVPKNASPGGHYCVIRFTGIPPQLKGQGVSLSASLGALVLLTVNGNIKHNLDAQQFTVSKNGHPGSFFSSAPLSFSELIRNNGNVQEQPTGLITVKDMFGRTTAVVLVNTPPHNVLPASTRKFTEQLDSSVLGNKHLFGHYTATMNLTYGPNKTPLTAKVSFWVIPWKLILGIVIALIIIFFLLRYLIRRYNKRIISRAQGPQPGVAPDKSNGNGPKDAKSSKKRRTK